MDLPRIFVPKKHIDNRGWFGETFREARMQELGILCRFVQDNQSYSKDIGTLRGLHFQLPPAPQAKLVRVLQGRILDIAVDLRKDSPTFGRHVSAEMSADLGHQIYIPIGFAHGFLTLENDVTVMYKVSGYYARELDSGIRWNDPDLGVKWPMDENKIILSDKDMQLPLLKDFASPFAYDGDPLGPLKLESF
jgi:dTDP-4-dehydrorhamnose 3,5-epimerase